MTSIRSILNLEVSDADIKVELSIGVSLQYKTPEQGGVFLTNISVQSFPPPMTKYKKHQSALWENGWKIETLGTRSSN